MIHRLNGPQTRSRYLPPDDSTESEATGGRAKLMDLAGRVQRLVVDRPKESLIAAVAVGVFLGWMTKRR